MDFSKLKKLESFSAGVRELDDDRLVTAIVKVRQPNYHPARITVRSQIDAYMFTAEFKARELQELEADPLVEVVSLSRPLTTQQ